MRDVMRGCPAPTPGITERAKQTAFRHAQHALPATRWLTCLTIDAKRFGATREEVRLALEADNIESRPLWKPMHLQPAFADCQVIGGAVSEQLFRDGLCLPSGSNMTDEDRDRVVEIVRSAAKPRRGVTA